LFLMKPSGPDPARAAVVGDEVSSPREPYRYAADISLEGPVPRITPGRPLMLPVTIRNTGDATWFTGSKSHCVRMGASFVTREGRDLTGEALRFELPAIVRPGEEVRVELSVVTPDTDPERLCLHIGLVKEMYFWFRDQGSPDLVIPLTR
jgi:hypothetical protein